MTSAASGVGGRNVVRWGDASQETIQRQCTIDVCVVDGALPRSNIVSGMAVLSLHAGGAVTSETGAVEDGFAIILLAWSEFEEWTNAERSESRLASVCQSRLFCHLNRSEPPASQSLPPQG